MAVYYVRPEGNDTNTGLGPATNLAWQTITKALGATGISSGDTLYIAPGTYRNSSGYTLGGNYNSTTYVYGDPKGAQFSGVTPGVVKFSIYTPNDNSAGTSNNLLSGTSKGNLYFKNIYFDAYTGSALSISITDNVIVDSCVFVGARPAAGSGNRGISFSSAGTTIGITVKNSIFLGFGSGIQYWPIVSVGTTCPFYAQDNLIIGAAFDGIRIGDPSNIFTGTYGNFHVFTNNTVIGCNRAAIGSNGNQPYSTWFHNNLCIANSQGLSFASGVSIESYNRLINNTTTLGGVTAGGNTITNGSIGIDIGENLLYGLTSSQIGSIYTGSPTAGLGTAGIGTFGTIPTSDLFGTVWANGSRPDVGAITTRTLANILPTYQPLERNSSSLIIAPGATSQSFNVYLGGTGISYNTSGLQAFYVRQNSAPVGIGLTWQTPTGTWKSGGFIEIDSTSSPGLYRLDLPNAAFTAGSSSVYLLVKGASGTNGAFINVSLSNVQSVIDTTQNLGSTTVGDALNSANSGGVGKWSISGDLLYLYAADGSLTKKLRVKNLRIDV